MATTTAVFCDGGSEGNLELDEPPKHFLTYRGVNAMAESFFATLECELLNRTTLSTHAEARAAVFDFVEGWYNTRRRHSALGYLSPLEFERLHAAAPMEVERPAEALQAPTSQLEPGSPAPTRVVTGFLPETQGGNDGLQPNGSPSASPGGQPL